MKSDWATVFFSFSGLIPLSMMLDFFLVTKLFWGGGEDESLQWKRFLGVGENGGKIATPRFD